MTTGLPGRTCARRTDDRPNPRPHGPRSGEMSVYRGRPRSLPRPTDNTPGSPRRHAKKWNNRNSSLGAAPPGTWNQENSGLKSGRARPGQLSAQVMAGMRRRPQISPPGRFLVPCQLSAPKYMMLEKRSTMSILPWPNLSEIRTVLVDVGPRMVVPRPRLVQGWSGPGQTPPKSGKA